MSNYGVSGAVGLIWWRKEMKCKEYNKGFSCDNRGSVCWSHHVAYGGSPQKTIIENNDMNL